MFKIDETHNCFRQYTIFLSIFVTVRENIRASGIQMVTILSGKSNPSGILYFLTAATKLIRYAPDTLEVLVYRG